MDEEVYESLSSEIASHLARIREEGERFEDLMEDKSLDTLPKDWRHTENVANRLHNLYTGLEHIFVRIAKTIDDGVPAGGSWHQELLREMAQGTSQRPPVIDDELRRKLLQFLRFRHFYRSGYGVDTKWEAMTDLVQGFDVVLTDSVEAIERFLKKVEP